MTVTVDKSGRVLIPKPVRDRLGLTPGTPLTLGVHDEGDGAPTLELKPETGGLVRKGGVLVHAGQMAADFDPEAFVREQRDRQHRGAAGLGA